MMRCSSDVDSPETPADGRQRRDRLRQDRVQRVERALALERRPAGEHLVEHDAEREDVAAVIDARRRAPAPATCTPRCRGRARRRCAARATLTVDASRSAGSTSLARPKSMILAWPSSVTITLAGFRSRWIDALLVRARQAFGDLGREVERARLAAAVRGCSVSLSFSPRISSIAMNVTPSASPTSWMTAMCGCSSARAARASWSSRSRRSRIVDEIVGQHLERDFAAEVHVDGAVDDAHAAAADLFDDLVVRECLTDHPFNIKNQERAASAARQRQSRGADQPPPRLRRSAEASAKAEAPRCW